MVKKEYKPIKELNPVPPDKVKISVLGNAVCFFFHRVFIVAEHKGYRLIAIHKDELLVNAKYKTAKGAKIAFLKLYWYQVWQEGVKPYWTDFYTPDDDWLKEMFNII